MAGKMVIGDLEILNALVCDDARRENNGKDIIIGVYGEDIGVSRFPSNLSLKIWMQLRPLRTGDIEFSVRMVNEKGIEFFNVSGGINVQEANKIGSMAIGGSVIQVQSEMTLIFQINVDEKGWENIIEIPVTKRQ